ncbi:MAG: hypothetical protein ACOVO1_10545 [Chitinophagaceae bacterium]
MKKINLSLLLVSLVIITSCGNKMTEEEIAQIGISSCRKPASFIKKIGFEANRSAFSTTELNTKGIVLIQFPKTPADTTDRKVFQDSTWKQFGFMGSLTTDENGNLYTAPIPMVNNLDIPIAEMNKIFKLDNVTGKLELFMNLPKPDTSVTDIVPFGILGIYFDCHSKKLYAASVSGSTRDEENGVIYVIDINTKTVIDQLKGYDAAGLFVGGTTGEKRLYFGSTRKPNIYSVTLTKDGKFDDTKIKTELTLDQLGPRGNDKARRIRYDKYGSLIVYGIEFNYSLAAQSNKPETGYQFNYNETDKKWEFVKILQ